MLPAGRVKLNPLHIPPRIPPALPACGDLRAGDVAPLRDITALYFDEPQSPRGPRLGTPLTALGTPLSATVGPSFLFVDRCELADVAGLPSLLEKSACAGVPAYSEPPVVPATLDELLTLLPDPAPRGGERPGNSAGIQRTSTFAQVRQLPTSTGVGKAVNLVAAGSAVNAIFNQKNAATANGKRKKRDRTEIQPVVALAECSVPGCPPTSLAAGVAVPPPCPPPCATALPRPPTTATRVSSGNRRKVSDAELADTENMRNSQRNERVQQRVAAIRAEVLLWVETNLRTLEHKHAADPAWLLDDPELGTRVYRIGNLAIVDWDECFAFECRHCGLTLGFDILSKGSDGIGSGNKLCVRCDDLHYVRAVELLLRLSFLAIQGKMLTQLRFFASTEPDPFRYQGWYYLPVRSSVSAGDWETCFHGTPPQNVSPILLSGLKKPGAKNQDGAVVDITNGGDHASIYVSPSLEYAAHPSYSHGHNCNTEFASVRYAGATLFNTFVFETKTRPGSYYTQGNTLSNRSWPVGLPFDPDVVEDHRLEYAVETAADVVVTGLLWRITEEGPYEILQTRKDMLLRLYPRKPGKWYWKDKHGNGREAMPGEVSKQLDEAFLAQQYSCKFAIEGEMWEVEFWPTGHCAHCVTRPHCKRMLVRKEGTEY
eukprot:TRINITY_DN41163_c0_g1_i1.p1 TRINITY_DN41163_c0_g1~~TRINITY_DN41163_c0_g1_i1.p1  ORF type:complete len:656 (+),score=55.97 TRINITY_DN41163_c0_g1_i1:171-2138(+)